MIHNMALSGCRVTHLYHFHNLGTIHKTLQTFSIDYAILLAGQQFIPPAKEEITGDEFEPRRERVAYKPRNQHHLPKAQAIQPCIP